MKNHSFCFNRIISNMFSQNCTLGVFITPSTMHVSSPSIDKYLGSSTFELFHTTFKFDEFGFLKSNLLIKHCHLNIYIFII